jgi:hypothetical protein
MAQVYGLIAEIWGRSAKAPTREDFMVVVEGVQTFPRSAPLVMQATILAAQRNFAKEALALAKHGQKIARTAAERSQFEMLASSFERDAAPEAAKPAAAPAPAPTKAKAKSKAKKDESYLPKLP